MTADDCPRVSMPELTDSSTTKQRKKSKWDQPAESLVSTGIAVSGIPSFGNVGSFIGPTHAGVAPVSTASLINPLIGSYGHLQQVLLAPSMQQQVTSMVQKIQPKIQEELIAREIVINDAESSVRYKLTKRLTQEDIQKCTGAIVITRGKYRPPNAPSDGEKPLYLHISAGTHLETTADRIKAVDQAAAMVEDIMKQGASTNGLKFVQPFSTSVFLGFEPDPSLNITARIRGPNDQYVNHIMNETGSTVLLRGRGSGNSTSSNPEEQQALHLFLSSSNPKSLERAKLLAENLLDTICAECGASRVSSLKVYGAVPPPKQLAGESIAQITANSASLTSDFIQTPSTSLVTSTLLSNGHCLPGVSSHPQSSLSHGTSYNGYGGIYPQATPLQQVALALRQSTSPMNSTIPATQKIGTTTSTVIEKEKRLPHKRKFQELPVAADGPLKTNQESKILKPSEVKSSMPAPVKLVQPSSKGMMPPPPPRTMPPPPSRTMPPPPPVTKVVESNSASKPEPKSVPETLISLMEYGDEDDDDIEETIKDPITKNSKVLPASKPFWAV
ncbi:protein RIK-like isoform X2 [Rutidosis leptorrhynchoides]|uniref:protein RIK-like isoform X2 n=1 Tax=Rutidosis leptorrhynchoides TaxID=125765 RepID=UPI003A99EBCE